jgi:transaldolase
LRIPAILNVKKSVFLHSLYFLAIKQFKPTDATTNPSLLLSAAQLPAYRYLIDQTVENVKSFPQEERMAECMDELVKHCILLILSNLGLCIDG